MNKQEAIGRIENSISQGAQLISPKGKSYEEHLREVSEKLFAHVIDPIEVTVKSAIFPEYAYEKYRSSKVWAIAKMGSSWLLTLESEQEFALGFGEVHSSIAMFGFSSSDAVGEWCG